ncbi:trehalose-6-phosphate synthase [Catellatospora sichuanensis]|uniref:trehalose-6-phosphate synthase n=1 Tax=Catellatospora sichuanensis TaxID=1969805 RepID=UPI001182F9A1|nr:trehalose-6-phosphate synthase [Catellatospora sichuanensis]
MSDTGRHRLILAADRIPPADTDDGYDHVEAALAALRPFAAAQDGTWVAAEPGDPHEASDAAHAAALLRSLGHDQQCSFPDGWFDTYLAVNRQVATAVAGSAADSAMVWVHGHQLQLLPAIMRRLRPDLGSVMQLHTTFPPAESLLRVPEHRALLSGLLGADVIVLPHRRAADNLLDLAGRVHGLPVRDGQIAVGSRRVRVMAYPLQADTAGIRRLAQSAPVRTRAQEIRAALRVAGPVLLSVAGWDPGEAVEQRLVAFERFLAEHRPAPATAALLHVACGEPQTPAEYEQRERVDRLIAKINGTYANVGQPVVHYLRAAPDRRELTALYLACDGLLATPAHHGTVAHAHEFVAAHAGAPVVVSELTCDGADLPGAVVVNPHDTAAFATAIARVAGVSQPVPGAQAAAAAPGPEAWARRLLAVATARAAAHAHPRPRRQAAAPGRTRPAGHQAPHEPARKIDAQ